MEESEKLVTCPSCAEEIRAEAIRCRHCGHMLIGEEWLGHARSYALMTPQERLEWMRSLTPDQGRRFRQVWKVFGPEAERGVPQPARIGASSRAGAVAQDRSKSNAVSLGCLAVLLLVLFLVVLNDARVGDSWSAGGGLFLLALGALVYLMPLVIATKREHHQAGAIAVINVFLGWTFIGWVIALAMACSAVRPHSGASSGQG